MITVKQLSNTFVALMRETEAAYVKDTAGHDPRLVCEVLLPQLEAGVLNIKMFLDQEQYRMENPS